MEKKTKKSNVVAVVDSADVNRALDVASKREGEMRTHVEESGEIVGETYLTKKEKKM